jgi:hypothetical protein
MGVDFTDDFSADAKTRKNIKDGLASVSARFDHVLVGRLGVTVFLLGPRKLRPSNWKKLAPVDGKDGKLFPYEWSCFGQSDREIVKRVRELV